MTDAAKREVSPEDNYDNDIRSDDPLFELSRIIGFGDDTPEQSSADIDPQIDLEEALMAEMAVEQRAPIVESEHDVPDFEAELAEIDVPDEAVAEVDTDETLAKSESAIGAPEPEQRLASLEDELAAMLNGAAETEPSEQGAEVVAQTPVDFEDLQADDEMSADADDLIEKNEVVEAAILDLDDELEAAQLNEANTEIETAEEGADPVFESPREYSALEAELSDDFDDEIDFAAELADRSAEIAGPEEPSVEAPVAQQVVDDEPVEVDDHVEAVHLRESAVADADIDDLDAALEDDFAAFFDEEIADVETAAEEPVAMPAAPKFEAAPVLETTDMSSFETSDVDEIDIPELPDLDLEFAADFSDEIDADSEERGANLGAGAAIAAVGAVAGASALAKRAGATAMSNDDDAFDESRFEAELARDMEFVTHDLETLDVPDELSVETNFGDQEFARAAAENRPAKRGLVVAAVLGCIAIAGAVGVFVFSDTQTTSTGEPVLVKADADPIKVAPENPGGVEVPNQDRAVFNETAAAPEQEELVSTSEEPVDIASVPETALPSGLNGAEDQKGEDRLLPNGQAEQSSTSGAIVTPRKVRTLVVRPDGTLVERAEVPTPEPIVPVVGGVPVVEQAEVPAATPIEEVAAIEPVATPAEPVATPAAVPAPAPKTSVPVRTVTTKTVTAPTQIANRPADQPVNIVNPEATQVAAAPAAPAPVAAPAAESSPFAVQLASLPTQADAQRSATNMSQKFGNVLGGRGVSIQSAVIDGRGTFYRVRVGASSRADANALCGQIKSAGGDCFVTR